MAITSTMGRECPPVPGGVNLKKKGIQERFVLNKGKKKENRTHGR